MSNLAIFYDLFAKFHRFFFSKINHQVFKKLTKFYQSQVNAIFYDLLIFL